MDTLLHAADGGQRAEGLGVEAPESVLPADLEERDVPWTEEPGGLQSVGSHGVGHDWVTEHIALSRTL